MLWKFEFGCAVHEWTGPAMIY